MRFTFLLTCALAAAQIAGQEAPKAQVEGTVVNEVSGAPVRRATVTLTVQRSGKSPESFTAQTEADGRFRFAALEPGNYFVIAQRSGYVNTGGRSAHSQFQLGASEQKTGVALKLTPQGIISGRVFDEEGEPVQGAQIQVLQRRRLGGKLRWMPASGGNTNDRGEYRVANLMAGDFAVSASYADPASQMGLRTQGRQMTYGTTFYPNSADLAAAQAVSAGPGAETAGIDLRLRKEAAYRVRVRVEGVSGEALQQANVSLIPRDFSAGIGRLVGGSMRLEPGLFELLGVRAGSWLAQAQVYQPGGEPLMGATPIEVSTADLSDVVVRVGAALQVNGKLVLEGTSGAKVNWKQYQVRLVSPEGPSYGLSMRAGRPAVTEEGEFTVSYSLPGKYLLEVQPVRTGKTYVASIQIGGEEYFGKEIDLSSGPPGAVKVVYRDDAAMVSGKLEGELTGGQTGMVVLVPVEAHLRRMEYMQTAAVRPDGSFALGPVRPGEYLLCHFAGDYQALAEEGEPPKASMDAALRLKALPGGTHDVQVKAVRAAAQP